MCRLPTSWTTLLCILLITGHASAAYFVPLGRLPGRGLSSYATDVSADGSVVVGYVQVTSTWFPEGEAFRWTADEGMASVMAGGFARGVSSDGSVIVGSSTCCFGPAFRWTSEAGPIAFGSNLGEGSTLAFAASSDGSVIVGSHNGQASQWTSEHGLITLDLRPGAISSAASDVSADGSVIVGGRDTGAAQQGFRWTADGDVILLGDLPGGSFGSTATGVSADGSVVVGWSYAGPAIGTAEAFRWTSDGGMVGLGDLPGGVRASYAHDISADGSIIVGYGESANGQEAFVWDAANGMRSVSDLLTGLGVDLTGWTLTSANAISADGTTIVGNGINPSGRSEAWLARIPVPEPTTSMMLTAAIILAAFRRPRRSEASKESGNL